MKSHINSMNPYLKDILSAIFTASMFSAFIYLAHFNLTCRLCDSLFALIAIALLLYGSKQAVLFSGFFIGLFWFYWIGYSFQYYGMSTWVEPLVALGFSLVYTLFFAPLALTRKVCIRGLILFGLSFIEPFGFNWMKIELLFVDSYFGISKLDLALVLIALSLPALLKGRYRYSPLLILVAALSFTHQKLPLPPLKIDLVATGLGQNEKWDRANLREIVNMNLLYIDDAVKNGYDVVVLPESAFPLYLNRSQQLLSYLGKKSKKIDIITGALILENGKHFNVTYHFKDGNYTIAKKMVLVPFGEYVPLPKFAQKWVSDTFFEGASDFSVASDPTDFMIKGIKFRNAICYEATKDELYKDNPKFMFATSNNAWFLPSVEPTIQRLLMKYYSKKYGTVIFHAANRAGTGIIR
ncbi:apolipoprotein N-acyltransferase [Sulfurimonas sp. HSL-1716]|uniref:apolipoprotein N-acyltransferase n=1 Tax=Hydrocurvibacter sulfurireducens TaxID=3131937 RepID=UPI0031F9A85D